MPRTARSACGGLCYHLLNHGNGRMGIFRKDADYDAFVGLLIDAKQRASVEVFDYCLMPNHWHLVARPRGDGDLARFMSWLTNTHVKRYRSHYTRTSGHLYQGRYKSFPVQEDGHLLTLLRYVQANPLRAKLVERAEQWRWSGLGCGKQTAGKLLDPCPVARPRRWVEIVNEPQTPETVDGVRTSLSRGRPLGSAAWVAQVAGRLNLAYTLNPRGRPANPPPAEANSAVAEG